MKNIIVGTNGVLTSNSKVLYEEDGLLPQGYTKLQYITAAGKSAINTNIVVDSTDKIIVKFSLASLTATGDKFIICGKAGGSGGGIWVETYNNTNKWYVRFGSSSSVNKAPDSAVLSGIHTFELRKQYFGVDESQVLTPSYSSMYSLPINIGGRLTANESSATGFYGNLYDTKIVASDGSLKWWGIPAKDSDNVVGLWDMVSDEFFISPTAYAFTAGPSA